MGIRLKFNLVLAALGATGVGLFALISGPYLKEQAREEVLVRSRIMMASAAGIRNYTSGEIAPLLSETNKENFRPQVVSSYAAVKTFFVLHAEFPNYSYREAALNPTNNLGPIARHVLISVASEVNSRDDLYQRLGARIAGESERAELLRKFRSL